MKHLSTILLLFIGLSLNAQESFIRFYVGASYSPDVAFRFLINSEGSEFISGFIEALNERDRPKFGMTTSLNAGFHVNKRLAIELGVGYSNRGFGTDPIELIYSDMIDPRFGFVYTPNPSSPATVQHDYDFHYLDVPVAAVFKLQFGKFVLAPRVGVTLNVLINSTVTQTRTLLNGEIERQTEDAAGDFYPVNITPILGIGFGIALNDRITIMASPKFKLGVVPIFEGSISNLLWNAGIGVGITYGFGAKSKEVSQ